MHTQLKKIVAVAGLVALALTGADAQVVAQWNFNSPALPGGLRNYGPDAYLPATIAPGFSTDGLTRGSGVVTNQYSGMAKAWGGYHFAESSPAAAATGGDYYAFSLSRDTAAPLSVTGIKTTLYRSNTGPTNALWQYRLAGAANWQDMGGTVNLAGSGSVSVLCDLDTSGIAGLQNIASSVTFRLVAWGGGPRGTFYFDGTHGAVRTLTVFGSTDIPETPAADDPRLSDVHIADISVSAGNVATLTWDPVAAPAADYFIYAKCALEDDSWVGVFAEAPQSAPGGRMCADFTLGDGSHTDYRFFTMRALVRP